MLKLDRSVKESECLHYEFDINGGYSITLKIVFDDTEENAIHFDSHDHDVQINGFKYYILDSDTYSNGTSMRIMKISSTNDDSAKYLMSYIEGFIIKNKLGNSSGLRYRSYIRSDQQSLK
ncbi:hypothetical protein EVB64_264 [Rhizobium phage RHph_TM61]|nr:hypothetical protein EVB64_264 [Rhizobium phage RHph_TM61]